MSGIMDKTTVKSKEKLKLPEKTPEQLIAEQHNGIINSIITQTFARHAGLSEKEYLKRLGIKNSKIGEARAVRVAKYNAILELTKVLLECVGKANMITNFYRVYLQENNIVERDNQNG